MWSCNEQRFWHGLPSDEHRPVLCPNTAESSEKEINKEFQVGGSVGVNKQDGSLLADDFFFHFSQVQSAVFSISWELSVELCKGIICCQLGATGTSRLIFYVVVFLQRLLFTFKCLKILDVGTNVLKQTVYLKIYLM